MEVVGVALPGEKGDVQIVAGAVAVAEKAGRAGAGISGDWCVEKYSTSWRS